MDTLFPNPPLFRSDRFRVQHARAAKAADLVAQMLGFRFMALFGNEHHHSPSKFTGRVVGAARLPAVETHPAAAVENRISALFSAASMSAITSSGSPRLVAANWLTAPFKSISVSRFVLLSS